MKVILDVSGSAFRSPAMNMFLRWLSKFAEGTVHTYDHRMVNSVAISVLGEDSAIDDLYTLTLCGTNPNCLGNLLEGPELKIHLTDGFYPELTIQQQNVIEIDPAKLDEDKAKHLANLLSMLEDYLPEPSKASHA
jgi:hypothetical protein